MSTASVLDIVFLVGNAAVMCKTSAYLRDDGRIHRDGACAKYFTYCGLEISSCAEG